MSDPSQPHWHPMPDGEKIAYLMDAGQPDRCGTLFLGGFKSDMTGTKASALSDWARTGSRPYTRFDYFGHGQSSGAFTDGTIGRWTKDALAVMDDLTSGPQVLIGSSMGGWIALLAALARPERVKGLVLIAPAPDFTEKLMWESFSEEIRSQLQTEGIYSQPSDYDEPYEITYRLIEDGRKHLLLDGPIKLNIPVRILQGMKDADVPWQHAMQVVDCLTSTDVTINLSKQGDHSLSTPADLARLTATLDDLCARIDGAA